MFQIINAKFGGIYNKKHAFTCYVINEHLVVTRQKGVNVFILEINLYNTDERKKLKHLNIRTDTQHVTRCWRRRDGCCTGLSRPKSYETAAFKSLVDFQNFSTENNCGYYDICVQTLIYTCNVMSTVSMGCDKRSILSR
jgi:hypothetical protein